MLCCGKHAENKCGNRHIIGIQIPKKIEKKKRLERRTLSCTGYDTETVETPVAIHFITKYSFTEKYRFEIKATYFFTFFLAIS